MTKDEALRLALEWLEAHKPKISEDSLPVLIHAQVRAAVKAALERKTEDAEKLGLNYYVPCCTDKTCPKCKAALEAKDEPEQMAKLGWQVIDCPICGGGARAFPKQEAKDEPVQVSPLQFVEMVMEKEHLVGKPIFWAEWPNKEKNT